MVGTILRLLKPSYAVLAMLAFGGWQGYSIIAPIWGGGDVQEEVVVSEEDGEADEADSVGPLAAAMRKVHPGMRIVTWLVIYGLLCFASVPWINGVLAKESNFANAVMLFVYVVAGFLLAFLLMAFQFNWATAIMLIMAIVVAGGIIVLLAGMLEKMRIRG